MPSSGFLRQQWGQILPSSQGNLILCKAITQLPSNKFIFYRIVIIEMFEQVFLLSNFLLCIFAQKCLNCNYFLNFRKYRFNVPKLPFK